MRRCTPLALALLLLALPGAASARTARIIGGDVADPAAWPSTVALMTTFGSQFCGGSIVAPRWVLTAGHCKLYAASSVEVLAGTADLRSGGDRIAVDRQLRHPRYRQTVPGAPRNDLMLLHLEQASVAPPIALASGSTGARTGDLLHVAGWGATSYDAADDSFGPGANRLRQTAVRVRDDDACTRAYGRRAYHGTDMLCAALPGRDACAGDSGGPLVLGPGPDAVLVGVVSWGTGCALRAYPGVYSLVARNRCWITSTIGPPRAPTAIALSEGDTSLQVDWRWTRPCPDAPAPDAFRVTIAETGLSTTVIGTHRRVTLTGLPTARTLTVSVAALNRNGAGATRRGSATTGPNPVSGSRIAWTGRGAVRVAFGLAGHLAALRWRLEAGTGLRFHAGPWHDEGPSDAASLHAEGIAGLPVGRAIAARIVVDDGTRVAHGALVQLPVPTRPAALGRVRVRGSLARRSLAVCDLGPWSGTRPFDVRRQWLLAGRAVRGATGRTLRITAAMVGRGLSCRVRIGGPGGVGTATSARRVVT